MSVVTNHHYNNNHAVVVYNDNSLLDHNDLEVEEILNDIGFFANENDDNDPLIDGEPEPGFPMSYIFPPVVTAPISPDHMSSSLPTEVLQSGTISSTTTSSSTNATITPSVSVQEIQAYLVPNPMAALGVFPSMTSSSSSSYPPALPNLEEHVQDIPPKMHKKAPKKEPSKNRKRKLPDLQTPNIIVESQAASTGHPMPVTTLSLSPQGLTTTTTKSTTETTTTTTTTGRNKDEGLTEEDLEERRQRNREHAKRSRQRKKSLTSTLEESVEDLKAENAKLREQIYAMIGPQKTLAMLEARKDRARTQFIHGLMQPRNRIMDEKTLTVLKNLRKNVTLDDDDSNSSKNPTTNC